MVFTKMQFSLKKFITNKNENKYGTREIHLKTLILLCNFERYVLAFEIMLLLFICILFFGAPKPLDCIFFVSNRVLTLEFSPHPNLHGI